MFMLITLIFNDLNVVPLLISRCTSVLINSCSSTETLLSSSSAIRCSRLFATLSCGISITNTCCSSSCISTCMLFILTFTSNGKPDAVIKASSSMFFLLTLIRLVFISSSLPLMFGNFIVGN
eukprot:NODE_419_length_8955_cov_0.206527.p5 type:complete len:122 gc:universal NODE_419_length_8955_cov_0.206527:1975-2340(+)